MLRKLYCHFSPKNSYNNAIFRNYSNRVFFSGLDIPNIDRNVPDQTENNKQRAKFKIPFSRENLGPFRQTPPKLENSFCADYMLQGFLKRLMPKEVYADVSADLFRFGDRIATDVHSRHRECETSPPYLRHYDAWGNRIDEIVTCSAWKWMKGFSAEEGLISLPYEKPHAEWSRLHQIVKHMMYNPSAGLYTCPLAMTDGAAKTLQDIPSLSRAYNRLISRDPGKFWTSGQWMTERAGGSDVGSATETIAVPQADGSYRLYGYKWFSSATDSDMALALAREVGEDRDITQGSRGLSMFYVEVRNRNRNKTLNSMQVIRLKDKLGTRQLPTAELLLDGSKASKVGDTGSGVKCITQMLELTRIHTATASAGAMRRIVGLARDYATKRTAFGRALLDHPLHMRTLASMELEARGCIILVLHTARLLGLKENGKETERENFLLRLLTPLLKMYASKQGVAVMSEGLECFGGAGFLEDTGLPGMLRDAQVCPIWEGTTNIISLDVLRAIAKSKGQVLLAMKEDVEERLQEVTSSSLSESCVRLRKSIDALAQFLGNSSPEEIELAARDLAFSLARVYIGSLLVEHASWREASSHDVSAAQNWCSRSDLCPLIGNIELGHYTKAASTRNVGLVMEGYHTKNLHSYMH